jgi:hypothetical protein
MEELWMIERQRGYKDRLYRWSHRKLTAESYGLIIGIEIKTPYLTLLVFLFCSWISNFLKYNPMFVLD